MADFRYALRSLLKSPGFLAIAVATLSLGIAANTAMFSLFYQVLLRTLPVPDPQELVVFHSERPGLPGSISSDNSETVFSYPMYKRLRDGARGFQGLAARSSAGVQFGIDGSADRGSAELVSANFFEVLEVRPRLGRVFGRGDDGPPGTNAVAVLSFDFWTRRFGENPAVLNRTILVNRAPFTVVGVAPKGFRGVLAGEAPDVFLPLTMKPSLSPGWSNIDRPGLQWLTILGRLAPGTSRERASSELAPLFTAGVRDHIEQVGVRRENIRERLLALRLELRPAAQGLNELERGWKKPLMVLLAMASLLLLIACANLANLLAARATNRAREISVRMALGATRWQIVRLLLAESALLAIAGTLGGILSAPVLARGLLRILPADALGGWITPGLSVPLLAFSVGVMVIVTLLCGLAPAVQAIGSGTGSLGERTSESGRISARGRKLLVAGQIALSLVLLVSAGLFARSLTGLMRHQAGFRAEQVLLFSINAGLSGYDADRGLTLYRDLTRRLEAQPGVDSVSLAEFGPLSNSDTVTNIAIEGYAPKGDEDVVLNFLTVGPGYFRTLGTPMMAGREFDERDNRSGPKAAVVNQAFVQRYFGGQSPIGRHMSRGTGGPLDITIVGVAADVKNGNLREPAKPTFYLPYEQVVERAQRILSAMFFVRARGGLDTLSGAVRKTVSALDPTVPVYGMRTMEEQVERSVTTDRLIAALSAAFAVIALVLTAVGLYGVIAYLVTRRTTEIGIRMALGATRGNIAALVLREAAVVFAVGAITGLAGAAAAGRAVESQLFGLRAFDPAVFALMPAALALVVALACSMPALRAARIEPVSALRHD